MSTLNGPRVSPPSGTATQLVVLCHGYGSDGNDLIGLAPHWRNYLPHAEFVAPNAPQRHPMGSGYQWFALSRIDPVEALFEFRFRYELRQIFRRRYEVSLIHASPESLL